MSASISSATTAGRELRTPVPISERWARMVSVPSGLRLSQRLGRQAVAPLAAVTASARSGTMRAGQDESARGEYLAEHAPAAKIADVAHRTCASTEDSGSLMDWDSVRGRLRTGGDAAVSSETSGVDAALPRAALLIAARMRW